MTELKTATLALPSRQPPENSGPTALEPGKASGATKLPPDSDDRHAAARILAKLPLDINPSPEEMDCRARASGYKNSADMKDCFQKMIARDDEIADELAQKHPEWSPDFVRREAESQSNLERIRAWAMASEVYVTGRSSGLAGMMGPDTALQGVVSGFNGSVVSFRNGIVEAMYRNLPFFARIEGHFVGARWHEDNVLIFGAGRLHRFEGVSRLNFVPGDLKQKRKHRCEIVRKLPNGEEKSDFIEVGDETPFPPAE